MTAFFQNTYGLTMPIGLAGRIADCGFKNTLSPVALMQLPPAVALYKPAGLDYRVYLPSNNSAVNVFSADLVTGNVVNATVNGVAISPVTYATSTLATMQAVATAIRAIPSVSSATVGGTLNRSITIISNAGVTTTVTGFLVTGGASQATVTPTIALSGTFFGVSQMIYNKMGTCFGAYGVNASILSSGIAPYFVGEVVPTLTQGRIYVAPETVVNSDSPVYVRVAANGVNTQLGAFRGDADGGNAVLVSSAYALWREGNTVAGGLAVLELNIP